jgi:hypothetical protein
MALKIPLLLRGEGERRFKVAAYLLYILYNIFRH